MHINTAVGNVSCLVELSFCAVVTIITYFAERHQFNPVVSIQELTTDTGIFLFVLCTLLGLWYVAILCYTNKSPLGEEFQLTLIIF